MAAKRRATAFGVAIAVVGVLVPAMFSRTFVAAGQDGRKTSAAVTDV